MPVDQPFNIYREQLSSLYHGLALWNPKPVENLYKQPRHVSIGDVGYLDNGTFMRMFNVTLPWDDPSNRLLGRPGKYKIIDPSHSGNVRHDEIREGEYYTHVHKIDNVGADRHEESLGQMYQCGVQHDGALLFLPDKGHRKDVIPLKVFKNYTKDNVDNWFRWSKEMMLPVEHMEELILVTGCTLVTSWAAAAFDAHMSGDSGSISLEARKSNGGGVQFFWRNISGNVEYHSSSFDPNVQELPQNQCVFIRGVRAKRSFFRTRSMRAAAEPLPDDTDDSPEDEIQVIRIPDGSKYRDPLTAVLDYILEKCREDVTAAEDIIAIAHDDDLQFIDGVETLTADAVENFLRDNKVPLLTKNGAAILCDQVYNKLTSLVRRTTLAPPPPLRGILKTGAAKYSRASIIQQDRDGDASSPDKGITLKTSRASHSWPSKGKPPRVANPRNTNPSIPPASLHWKLLPFDSRSPRGELQFDLVRKVDEIILVEAGGSRPLSVLERNKSASEPSLTEMVIHCPELPDWPVYVARQSGIRCVDVFEAIRDTYNVVLTATERSLHQSRVRDIERRRPPTPQGAKRGLRRRDLLDGKTLFLGLDWKPSDALYPGGCWSLNVGFPSTLADGEDARESKAWEKNRGTGVQLYTHEEGGEEEETTDSEATLMIPGTPEGLKYMENPCTTSTD